MIQEERALFDDCRSRKGEHGFSVKGREVQDCSPNENVVLEAPKGERQSGRSSLAQLGVALERRA